jgi:phage N-6-adenine-methyltransferase
MSLVGFSARNHPQQTTSGADDSADDRATTADVFDPLMAEFGFTIDVAAAAHNTKCKRYYDRVTDGLAQSWAGERVWCNPPFSDLRPWVEKAWKDTAELVVMLLPANRTEQTFWQDLIEPWRDRPGSPLTVRFIAGRIRFLSPHERVVAANGRPPFGCCLLIWDRRHPAQPSLLDVS